MDNSDDRRRGEKVAFLGAAAISFCTTIYLLVHDKTASASIAGAFTIALLLFHFVPIVESFEVFGLKARLRHGVTEVNRLLGHITKTAEVSSKLLYIQLAWMNRMGTITWTKKRELLSDVDGLLRGVGIPDDEITGLKQPFLIMISRDLHAVFEQFIRFRLTFHAKAAEKEFNEVFGNKPIDQNDPRYAELNERRKQWAHHGYDYEDILADKRLLDLESLTKETVAAYPFPDDDLGKIEPIRNKVVQLARDCWTQGTITPEAEEFIEAYDYPQDKLCKEVFDGNP